jgi:hypothetical protein
MSRRLYAIALVDDPTARLRLFACSDGMIAAVPGAGLNVAVVGAWTRRLGVALLDEVQADVQPAPPLGSLATVVIVADARVGDLARTYAQAVGAPAVAALEPDAVAAEVAIAAGARSATLVVLNDALDEPLVSAVDRGNSERVRRGRAPLTVGIVTAFDLPKLAWLLAKTLVLLDPPAWPDAAIGRFDGVRGEATRRPLDGSRAPTAMDEPWNDPRTLAQSVVGHGVAFDLSLGDVVLCGHLDPPLPAVRRAVAPSCFHDGICFRLAREGGPTVRRYAHDATPLVWGIDSCGVVPFRGNAFGDGSSYALALLAGSAVAVIGPYLTMTTSGLAARAFEALLEDGWSTGEIGAALGCIDDNSTGFAPYLVLGSPDVRLAGRPGRSHARRPDGAFDISLAGSDVVAVDLPPESRELREVVGDDGGEAWTDALARRVDAPARAAVVLAFDRPQRFAGWVRLGDANAARAALAERCDELERRLGVLAGYEFAKPDAPRAEAFRDVVRDAAVALRAPHMVRASAAGAFGWQRAHESLPTLEESVARGFIAAVVEHDVSFDRESENGFVPGTLRRTGRLCHVCGGTLYEAADRWAADEDYQRIKATCPNCFGVELRLTTSSLAPVRIAAAADGTTFRVRVTLRSDSGRALCATVAAAPRRGPRDHAVGPLVVHVPERGDASVDLEFPSSRCGVVTHRILVLCEGAAELYTVVDPGAASSAAMSSRRVTVVGSAAPPAQGRPAGLNQTG